MALTELVLGAGTLTAIGGAVAAQLAVPSGPAVMVGVGCLAVGGSALAQRHGGGATAEHGCGHRAAGPPDTG